MEHDYLSRPALTRRESLNRAPKTKHQARRRTEPGTDSRPPRAQQRTGAKSRVVTAAAAIFAATLLFATSTPAGAVASNPGVFVMAPDVHQDAPSQTFSATGAAPIIGASDVFSATSAAEIEASRNAEIAAAGYTRTSSTFTNSITSPVQWPFVVGVPISDDFGPRASPCAGCSTMHKGLDMTPGEGSPIQVIADGVVRETGESDSGFGVYAIIDHVVDGEKVSSLYAHMQFGSLRLAEGQPVKVGQPVGQVGNTGQSTGPHLHFELLLNGSTPTDPYTWLSSRVAK
ncbi:M23 family metallopeptidase [Cryobacterium sp. 1639]|uniref:M23 family metallopeptidase n=1 Tax=Cryobacterium inferilacus TaxID=2866629 RepID=UPI001C73D608|nr:M23 family metallopeptidase [Cryobacterium sp. 1639]MBX0301412.1 M23 family metallopeptidase [Cryobacterium sp. 1639]